MATLDDTIGTQGATATGGEGTFTLDASASDPLTLPEGLNPAMADFSHEGPDMVMTWPDGSQVTVTDYFMVEPQPTLASEQGATVSGELAARLSGPVAPGMVAEAGSGIGEQPIGQVEKLDGTVTVIRADGTKLELKVGDQVFQGDILETGADGALGVILADETTFSMAEEGRMVLDEMIYDPGTQEGSVSLSVMHGVFTFVSGQVAKTDPDAMTLTTPVATIGIRGTQVGLDLTDGQNLQVALMEEADGFVGEVVIMNDGGVTVLNGANEFSMVSSYGFAPTETAVMQNNDMINMFSPSLRHLPMNNANVNDFGLQGETVQEDMSGEGLADFETAAGGEDEADAEAEAEAKDLNDMDVAAGEEDAPVDDGPITPEIDIIGEMIVEAPIVVEPVAPVIAPVVFAPTITTFVDNTPDTAEVNLTVEAASGAEDAGGGLALTIGVSGGDGDMLGSITISGVPTDATLSSGTDNGGGTWTVTPAELAGLTLHPAADYSGSFDLTVKAMTTDGTASATTTGSLHVDVTPVADAPTLYATSVAGTPLALDITTAATDVDGSETLSVTVTNVPAGATLSAGTYDAATDTWTLDPATDLAGLTITLPADVAGTTVDLVVTSTSTDALGNVIDTASTQATVSIDVPAPQVAVTPNLTIEAASGAEDGTLALNISAAPGDDTDTISSITISGVPSGATLSAGTDNGDGTWTLNPDQLTGLTLSPDADYSGSFDLTVTATAVDGTSSATSAGSLNVNVTPVADAPTLSTAAATGAEDSAIALNISTAETDVDGSEVLSMTISGVPTGAELSAGTDNLDGTWTLDPATDLTGLTITPPANFNGTINLSVTSTSTDTLGNVTDSASTTGDIAITVVPVGDQPGITLVGNNTGAEDGTVDIGIIVTPANVLNQKPGTENVETVTITGVPEGGTLNVGTLNDDGSWTITSPTASQLTTLTMTPPADYSGTPTLGFTVVTNEGGTNSANMGVTVTPVADAPTLDINPSAGLEDTPIDLNIATAETDVDGSEVLFVTIGNVPTGASLTAGSQNEDGTWTLTPDQLTGLQLNPAADFNGDFTLSVTSTSTDTLGVITDSAVTTGTLTVSVAPVGDSPDITLQPASGAEDGSVSLNIGASATGGESIASITISGVPTDATLSLGTDNGNGSWTLTNPSATDLSNLTMSPAADFSGSFNLAVTATSSEGGVNSATMGVDVTPVADAPTLTTAAASGAEDSAIALNISTAETDVDGSETLSVTIGGVPTGATLSVGTNNQDGTWTLTPDQLTDLTITPDANFNGSFDLTVTSTSTDGTDTATTTNTVPVTVTAVGDGATIGGTAAAGTEDNAIALDITATATGGVAVTSVTITGVPAGASLTAGTDNGGGSWTLTPDQLTDLSLNPPADYSGSFDLNVSATSADGTVTTATSTVAVEAVADAPTLDVSIGAGVETTATGSLTLENMGQASAGYENSIGWYRMDESGNPVEGGVIWADAKQSVGDEFTIDGVDASTVGFFLISDGGTQNSGMTNGEAVTFQQDGSGSWQVIDSNGATLNAIHGNGAFFTNPALNADGYDHEADGDGIGNMGWEDLNGGGDQDFNDVNLNLTSQPGGVASTTFDVNITSNLTDTDGSETLSVIVAGIPADAELSAGTHNADGTWTLTPDQLTGLSVTVPSSVTADFDLTVTATATEPNGDTASVSQTAAVDVPDAPTEPVDVADTPTLETGIGGAEEVDGVDYSDIKFGDHAGKNAGKGVHEEHGDDHDDDVMLGDSGRDYLDGEGGDDVLAGMGGADKLEGEDGDDVLFGGAGSDKLEGDDGDDILFGGSGNDKLEGGDGDDFLIGGAGNDEIKGGDGDDVIVAGGGYNKVDGGDDDDTMVFNGARGDYLITEVVREGRHDDHDHEPRYIIEHLNGGADGISQVENVETFQFADGQFSPDELLSSNSLTYDISIEAGLTDTDGSEILSDITISDVPSGATFSAGTDNGDNTWTMNSNDLGDLSMTIDNTVDTDFQLNVSVTSTETESGATSEPATSVISVDVPADHGALGDTSVDALDPLSVMFTDSDTLKVGNEEYDISSLTDGDSTDTYGDVAPLGTKNDIEGYDPNDSDASDGYSVTPDTPVDDGTGGGDN